MKKNISKILFILIFAMIGFLSFSSRKMVSAFDPTHTPSSRGDGSAEIIFTDTNGNPITTASEGENIYIEIWYHGVSSSTATSSIFNIYKTEGTYGWGNNLTIGAFEPRNIGDPGDFLRVIGGAMVAGTQARIDAQTSDLMGSSYRLNATYILGRYAATVNTGATDFTLRVTCSASPGSDAYKSSVAGVILTVAQARLSTLTISSGPATPKLGSVDVNGNQQTAGKTVQTSSDGLTYTYSVDAANTSANLTYSPGPSTTITPAHASPGTGSLNGNTVTLGPVGSTTVITLTASVPGATDVVYTINIVRKQYTDCLLTALNASVATGFMQLCDQNTGNSTTFSPTLTAYIIRISSTATGFQIQPTVDPTTGGTIKVGTTNPATGALSGGIYAPASLSTPIYVTVTAQDGTTKQTYSITFDVIQTQNKLTSFNFSPTAAGITESKDFENGTITISNVPFSVKNFTFNMNSQKAGNILRYGMTNANLTATAGNNISPSISFPNVTTATSVSMVIEVEDKDTNEVKQYTLTVNRLAASSDNTIIQNQTTVKTPGQTTLNGSWSNDKFTIPAATTTLKYVENSVGLSLGLPAGATAQVLSPSGATGTSPNFTVPITADTNTITVRVTAEDGTTKDYTFEVNRIPADKKVDLNDNGGTIAIDDGKGTSYSYSVNGTDITFSGNMPYDVKKFAASLTLQSGSLVKIEINNTARNSGQALTGINVGDGTSLSTSQTTVSFTIKITAEDNSTSKTYTVTGYRDAANYDVSLKDPNVTGNLSGVVVPKESTSTTANFVYMIPDTQTGALVALEATDPTAKITYILNGGSPQNYSSAISINSLTTSSTIVVTVTAQYGNNAVYTITVDKARSSDCGVANIEVRNGSINLMSPAFSPSITTYNITVDYTVNTINLVGVLSDTVNAQWDVNPSGGVQYEAPKSGYTLVNTNPYITTIYMRAIAQNGDIGQTYTIIITKQPANADNYLLTLEVDGNTVAPSYQPGGTFDYFYNPLGGLVTLTYTYSANATCNKLGNSTTVFINAGAMETVVFEITSQSGVKATYTLRIYAQDTNYNLNNIELLESGTTNPLKNNLGANAFTFDNTKVVDQTVNITLPYGVNSLSCKVSTDSKAVIVGIPTNGIVTWTGSSHTFTVKVQSEYKSKNATATGGESISYTFIITNVAGKTDADLLSLSISGVTHNGPFSLTEYFRIAKATAAIPMTFVVSDGATYTTNIDANGKKANVIAGTNFLVTVIIKSEDNSTINTYNIYLCPTDDDHSIISMKLLNSLPGVDVKDAQGNILYTYNAANQVISITVPYTYTSVYLQVVTAKTSASIKNAGLVNLTPGVPVNLDVYVVSEFGVKSGIEAGNSSDHYFFTITRANPDNDVSLSALEFTVTYKDDQNVTKTVSGFTFDGNNSFTTVNKLPNYVTEIFVTTTLNAGRLSKVSYHSDPTTIPNGTEHMHSIGTTSTTVTAVSCKVVITSQTAATSKDYNIKIDRLASNGDNSLKTVSITGASSSVNYTGVLSGDTYTFTIPVNDNTVRLNLEANAATSKIYVSTTPTDLLSDLYNPSATFAKGDTVFVTVVPEHAASAKTYTLKLNASAALDSNHNIVDIDVEGLMTFSLTEYNYTIEVPHSKKQIEISGVIPAKAKWKSDSGFTTLPTDSTAAIKNLAVGDNVFKFTCIAEDSSYDSTPYVITIKRAAAKTDADLLTVKINGVVLTGSFVPNSTYHYLMPSPTTSVANVDYTYSDGASTNQANPYVISTLTAGQTRSFDVTITSEDGYTSNTYYFTVYSMYNMADITNIKLLDKQGGVALKNSSGTQAYTFSHETNDITIPITVNYATEKAFFDVINTGTNAVVTGKGNVDLVVGLNIVEVYCVSQYYDNYPAGNGVKTAKYTFEITRLNADLEDRLATFSLMIDGVYVQASDIIMDLDNLTDIKINNVSPTASQFVVNVTPKGKATILSCPSSGSITFGGTSGGVFTFQIQVQNERKDPPRTYTVILNRENIVYDSNNAVSDIKVTGSDSVAYLPSGSLVFNAATYKYEITVPGTLSSVTITLTPASTKATAAGDINVKSLNPGTNTFKVYAVAEDTTKGSEYEIVIIKETLDTDNTLDEITINGVPVPGINPYVQANAKVNLPNGTTSVNIQAMLNSSKSTIVTGSDIGSNIPLNVGDNTFSVTVKAEDGSTKVYTFTVTRDEVVTLADLAVTKELDTTDKYTIAPAFNSSITSYNLTVDHSVEKVNITYLLNASDPNLVTVTGAGVKTLSTGPNVYHIVITPKSGSNNAMTYTVTINRTAARTGNYLESVEFNGAAFAAHDKTKNTQVICVSRDTSLIEATNWVASDGATVVAFTNKALEFSMANDKVITVTSESGSVRTYTFRFYRASQEFEIIDIKLKDLGGNILLDTNNNVAMTFDPTKLNYSIVVPNNITYVDFDVTYSQYAELFLKAGVHQLDLTANTPKQFTFQATSEYGILNSTATGTKSQNYTITITREPLNTDSTLSSLAVIVDGVDMIATFNPSTLSYVIENVGDTVTSIQINATPNATTSKVFGTGSKALNSTNGYNFNFTVTCTAEDGTKTDYDIQVSRGPLNADEDNNLVCIDVFDSANVYYLDSTTFNVDTKTYDITIPFGPVSYTITPKIVQGSPATIVGGGQFLISSSNWGTTVTHTVYATSKKGVDGDKYTVNVTISAPSVDNSLVELKADGTLVPGFVTTGGTYNLNRTFNETSITLTAIATDPFAKVTGTGTFQLKEGLNTYLVTVTSQDGTPAYHYVYVTRAFENPYLMNLGVNGSSLLDANGKTAQFEETVLTYYVVVPYPKASVEIYAVLKTPSDYVIGTGNKNLIVGENAFTVTVISANGTETEYVLNIKRLPETSQNTDLQTAIINQVTDSGQIEQLEDFKQEFKNGITIYGTYTVPNNVTSLQMQFIPENATGTPDLEPAKVDYYGNDNLKVGHNTVLAIVTAADGVTSKSYIINVYRKPMSYEVNENPAGLPVLTEDPNKLLTYSVDLGKTNPNSVDFSKYIDITDKESLTKVEVMTNLATNPNEVLIKVSDGDDFDIVKINLNYAPRADLEFEVIETEGVSITADPTNPNKYNIAIGNQKVADVDFKDLINILNSENTPVIEVITDLENNPTQVVVKITDGSETEFITFDIDRDADLLDQFKDSFLWLLLLVICAVILTAILVSVRKDKYGKINKNRKAIK